MICAKNPIWRRYGIPLDGEPFLAVVDRPNKSRGWDVVVRMKDGSYRALNGLPNVNPVAWLCYLPSIDHIEEDPELEKFEAALDVEYGPRN